MHINNLLKSSGIVRVILTSILVIHISGCTGNVKKHDFDPVELVNPLMGTDSEFRLSNGNTYPAIALPWGMNFWSPQTGKMGDGWGYTFRKESDWILP